MRIVTFCTYLFYSVLFSFLLCWLLLSSVLSAIFNTVLMNEWMNEWITIIIIIIIGQPLRSFCLWLDFDLSSCDEDVVNALRKPMFGTVFLHVILSFVRWYTWCTVRFKSSQSSLMLSRHFFIGLPLGRCPRVCPCSRLSVLFHTRVTRHVSEISQSTCLQNFT